MLHYDPQRVSSSTLLILRRTNCITTASGIVALCKQPYSMRVESGLQYNKCVLVFMYSMHYSCHVLIKRGFYRHILETNAEI